MCPVCNQEICICNESITDFPSEKDLQNWNEANDYTNEGESE